MSPCHSVEVNATLNKYSPQQIPVHKNPFLAKHQGKDQPEDQLSKTKVEAGENGWRKWLEIALFHVEDLED